jgi:hypothetical protein
VRRFPVQYYLPPRAEAFAANLPSRATATTASKDPAALPQGGVSASGVAVAAASDAVAGVAVSGAVVGSAPAATSSASPRRSILDGQASALRGATSPVVCGRIVMHASSLLHGGVRHDTIRTWLAHQLHAVRELACVLVTRFYFSLRTLHPG